MGYRSRLRWRGSSLSCDCDLNGATSPLMRSVLAVGRANAAQYRVSIKCEVAGVASVYLDQVTLGDMLEVSAPRGSFTLEPGQRPLVLASAGIGITPVLAILHRLAAEPSTREIWWLYGARNGRHHPFVAESRELLRRLPHGRSRIWYSRPTVEDRLGTDFDAAGHLTVASVDALKVSRDADFYVCGPTAFMRALCADLANWGVPCMRIHTEAFGSGNPHAGHRQFALSTRALTRRGLGSGPLVSFARSDLSIRWHPKYRSLLELAEACDVPVRWSCRTGVCHTCETGLVDGAVDYQPDPLESPADGNLLICCSRPRSDVVIDL